MEVISTLFGLALVLAPIIGAIALAVSINGKIGLSKGEYCEKIVSRNLRRLDSSLYTVIDNVILPSNGNTSHTQIDHIVVSQFGVFCLETKSHKGWIFGSSDRKYWTQVLYRDKYKIYNPLWQNFAHTKALESLLGLNLRAPIVPIVVFPNADKIKVSGSSAIGNIEETLRVIAQHKTKIYDPDQYDMIVRYINIANKNDQESIDNHNMEVRALVGTTSS